MGKKRVFEENRTDIQEDQQEESQPDERINQIQSKKQKIKKPLPPGYICNACGVIDQDAIYDCPLKIKKKERASEVNMKSNSNRFELETNNDDDLEDKEENEPQENIDRSISNEEDAEEESRGSAPQNDHTVGANGVWSLFISGLPFDSNKIEFLKFISKSLNSSDYHCPLTTRDIVLLNFPDNPSRCNGLGYINCSTEDDYQKCLEGLDGLQYGKLKLSVRPSNQSNKKSGSKSDTVERVSSRNKRRKKNKKIAGDGSEVVISRCYRCGQAHDPKTCNNPRMCYRCRGTDHISSECPRKKQN